MFSKLTATKSGDAHLAILLTPMEEIMELPMEASHLANKTLQFPETLLMVDGHFNGLGSEELSLSATTTLASISPSLEEHRLSLLPFTLEEITLTPTNRSASFSIPTNFTYVSMNLAILPSILPRYKKPENPLTFR
jgi:hypothetical protein